MIWVYSATDHPRLRYALDVLFGSAGLVHHLTLDRAGFEVAEGIKIAYTEESITHAYHIAPGGLVSASVQAPEHIATGKWREVPTLFHHHEGECGFDLFSAVFFLASRIEEYGEGKTDAMGRFLPGLAVQVRNGWNTRPLIDEWRVVLLDNLRSRWPEVSLQADAQRGELTVDVDSAFACLHKGLYRTVGGIFKDLSRGDLNNLKRRVAVLTGAREDHYDTYQYIMRTATSCGAALRWFFLLADFGTYDKNVPHTSKALRRVIRKLSETNPVGIHPGIGSHAAEGILKREIARLAEITGSSVSTSRQHYLKLSFPETYRRLVASGIAEDHSMGWATDSGFRLGTAFPVKWYDVHAEKITALTLVPFCAMDTTLRKYLRLTPDEAIERLRALKEITARTGGSFRVLWHNETVSDSGEWSGWRIVFEEAARLAGQ
jgi:hypothetical protein